MRQKQLKEIGRALQLIESRVGDRHREVFRTFLYAAFLALRNDLLPESSEEWERNEAEYMRIVQRYEQHCGRETAREIMNAHARVLGILHLALHDDLTDALGPLFMEHLAIGDPGQIFTPPEIGELIAQFSLSDARERLKHQPFILVEEPAAGAGGMVLAAAKALCEQGGDVGRQVHFVLTDVDRDACHAAYIQCTLAGISATVRQGNSITQEITAAWSTPAFYAWPKTPDALQGAPNPVGLDAEPAGAAADEASTEKRGRSDRVSEQPAL